MVVEVMRRADAPRGGRSLSSANWFRATPPDRLADDSVGRATLRADESPWQL
jgi:hypothetical protein